MAGNGIGTVILFISGILIAAGVGTTLFLTADSIDDSLRTAGEQISQSIDSDISIISDPGSNAIYDENSDELVLLVKNTGTNTIDNSTLYVLINGQYNEPSNTEVIGGDIWREGEVLRVTVDTTLTTGEEYRFVVGSDDARDTIKVFIE